MSNLGVEPIDSLSHIRLEEVVVSTTRASRQTPVAYSNINVSDIREQNAARAIPVTLQSYPSVVAFTEDGLGVGNTSFRIRGTDATRVNVTLNGMPLNNPESQELFWVNLPDLSSSLPKHANSAGRWHLHQRGGRIRCVPSRCRQRGGVPRLTGKHQRPWVATARSYPTIAAGSGILRNTVFSLDVRFSRVLGDGLRQERGKLNHKQPLRGPVRTTPTDNCSGLVYLNGGATDRYHLGRGVGQADGGYEEYGRRYQPRGGRYYDDAGNPVLLR